MSSAIGRDYGFHCSEEKDFWNAVRRYWMGLSVSVPKRGLRYGKDYKD